jgi:3-hydroxyacyl-[acyl-carrier-protein] dehydratase
MPEAWDIKKIQEILPQKYPFLFIDKVLEIDREQGKIICLKNVTANDYFFVGHFPDRPIMPGVIIIEAMAQASILGYAALYPDIAAQKPGYFLGKVEAKFSQIVKVGDQLVLEVQKEKLLKNAGVVKALAKVDSKIVAEARIAFGVILNMDESR